MVVWMIGLSRAGKTTLSKLLHKELKLKVDNLVLIDGDVIRDLFGNDVDHSIEGRRKNAERLSQLSKFLSDQNIHVIAAVLSIFPQWQDWNRLHIKDYREIYIKVPIDVLETRDVNQLYSQAKIGKIKNVVGVDIPFPEPKNSDLIIENNITTDDFSEILNKIMKIDVIRKIKK
ncbi:adenylyl-sulfate kinase [Candidatus Thioglobus sp.]|nr:adenylyl-sulfate kinase [Candidatus Thioglobus sp.]